MRPSLLSALVALAATGCAAPGFEKLYPGMTAAQVADTMGKGPARAQEFADGSAAWYFDEDHCVLMRDQVLVAKSTTETRTEVRTPVGKLESQSKAWCGPPGTDGRHEQHLETPFGTFKGTVDPTSVTDQVRSSVPAALPPTSDGGQATQPAP